MDAATDPEAFRFWSVPNGAMSMRTLRTSITLMLTYFLLTAAAQAQEKTPAPPPRVKIGDVAPDFTLVDQNGQPHSLHDFKSKKNVVLAFYVFAFTPG
jgi:cytochrome oxidase Cu insertion factor (SCO1/SenC/PrrC family)